MSIEADSACAPRAQLESELRRLGLSLVEAGDLRFRLTPRDAGGLELRVSRGGRQVLQRELHGTCEDSGPAVAVVLERYVRALEAAVPVPVATRALDGGAAPTGRVDAPRAASAGSTVERGSVDAAQSIGAAKPLPVERTSGKRPSEVKAPAEDLGSHDRTSTGASASGGRSSAAKTAAVERITSAERASPGVSSSSERGTVAGERPPVEHPSAGKTAGLEPTASVERASPGVSSSSERGTVAGERPPDEHPSAGKKAGLEPTASVERASPGVSSSSEHGTVVGERPPDEHPSAGKRAELEPASVERASPGVSSSSERPKVADAERPSDGHSSAVKTPRLERPASAEGTSPVLASSAAERTPAESPSAINRAESGTAESASEGLTAPPLTGLLPNPAPGAGLAWEIFAGGGAIAPSPATVSPLFSLEGRLFLSPHLRLGLLGAFSLGGSTPVVEASVTRGAIISRDVLALPAFSLCTDTWLRLCGGALAGLRLTLGQATGSYLFQTKAQVATGFTGGLVVDLTLPVRAFRASLGLGGLINPAPGTLVLQDLSATVRAPLFEGFALLRIGLGPGVP